MSGNELTEIALKELSRFGIKGCIEERGKHLGVFWQINGHRRTVFMSRTPSDKRRSGLHVRADVRRELRKDSVSLEETAPRRTTLERALQIATPINTPALVPSDQRISQLTADFDALLDLVGDLQSSISALEARLASARVVSTVTFDAAPKDPEPEEEVKVEVPVKFEAPPTLPQGTGPSAAVYRALLGRHWVHISELIPLVKNAGTFHSTIRALSKKGVVERGLRGFVRAIPGVVYTTRRLKPTTGFAPRLPSAEVLALLEGGDWKRLRDLSVSAEVSLKHMSAVLYNLSKKGLVERGERGFYRLKRVEGDTYSSS